MLLCSVCLMDGWMDISALFLLFFSPQKSRNRKQLSFWLLSHPVKVKERRRSNAQLSQQKQQFQQYSPYPPTQFSCCCLIHIVVALCLSRSGVRVSYVKRSSIVLYLVNHYLINLLKMF